MNAVLRSIEKRLQSTGSAGLGDMRLTDQMPSIGIIMVLFGLSIGSARISPECYVLFLVIMKTASTMCATNCVGGIFA